MPHSYYRIHQKILLFNRPNQCKNPKVKLFIRSGKPIWLCSCCDRSGDEEVCLSEHDNAIRQLARTEADENRDVWKDKCFEQGTAYDKIIADKDRQIEGLKEGQKDCVKDLTSAWSELGNLKSSIRAVIADIENCRCCKQQDENSCIKRILSDLKKIVGDKE